MLEEKKEKKEERGREGEAECQRAKGSTEMENERKGKRDLGAQAYPQ